MKKFLIVILLLPLYSHAQNEYYYPTQLVGFVYIHATSDGKEAKDKAGKASELLNTDDDITILQDALLGSEYDFCSLTLPDVPQDVAARLRGTLEYPPVGSTGRR